MTAAELKAALEAHGAVLAARGCTVRPAVIEPPATPAELARVEAELGCSLPESFRHGLATISRAVHWRWSRKAADKFPEPFRQIFSGELHWSLDTLATRHGDYLAGGESSFPDPQNPYDAVWHGKVGFMDVGNGDFLAVDLASDRAGAIVYLSHDDGEGHGYVMAHSLVDLLDRWVPLACPGAEDCQWLPFVPYDQGPIDPASVNGTAWRALLGLVAAPPRTTASAPDDELFDALVARGGRAPLIRALTVCSPARAPTVVELMHTDDGAVQAAAATLLGRWQWEPALPALRTVAVGGTHNGRLAAMRAIASLPGPEAAATVDDLRTRFPAHAPYLRKR